MAKISNKTFTRFEELIKKNLNKNKLLSEDTIRYLFYLATIETVKEKDIGSKIIPEMPYYCAKKYIKNSVKRGITINNRCSLDTFVNLSKETYAIEFKYHHKVSSNGKNKAIPHASYAGEVFNDFYRLSIFNNGISKYFVYVSDEEMIDNYKKNDEEYVYRKLINNTALHITNKDFKNGKYKTFNDDSSKFFNLLNAKTIRYSVIKIYDSVFNYKTKKYHVLIFSIK